LGDLPQATWPAIRSISRFRGGHADGTTSKARGRDYGNNATPIREDEELEEQINFRDILRVGVYLKPYIGQVARILAVVVLMSCILVAVPYLIKIIIDYGHSQQGHYTIARHSGRRFLAADRVLRAGAAVPHGFHHTCRPADAQGYARDIFTHIQTLPFSTSIRGRTARFSSVWSTM
jgi:ATP-binding cassette subfamily B protein